MSATLCGFITVEETVVMTNVYYSYNVSVLTEVDDS